jgi:hypothetical protein
VILPTTRAIASVTASPSAYAAAFHIFPVTGLELAESHHFMAGRADTHFNITAVHCRPSTAAGINPDPGRLHFSMQVNAVEIPPPLLDGILYPLAMFASLAVVDNGCHSHSPYR